MLVEPALSHDQLAGCLLDEYRLEVAELTFLPLGADVNTAVYRILARDGKAYFLKLRSGSFDQVTVILPGFLMDQGIGSIIAPIDTGAGRPWTSMGAFAVILYPFVEGRDGYEVGLSQRQWLAFGAALRGIHAVAVPPALAQRIPLEDFSPRWRELARSHLARAQAGTFDDPIAAEAAAFLRSKQELITDLVERAGHLASALRERSLPFVLCHGDIHPGNLMLGTGDAFHIVDWDTLIFAPKERDLMFVGPGGYWREPGEGALFYRGYGETTPDAMAMAYFRYERIVEDVATFSEQLFSTEGGEADRRQALRYMSSSFLPGQSIEAAYGADASGREP